MAGVKIREIDKKHRRKWFDNSCQECQSRNLTPMSKEVRGKEDWCQYLCEECKAEFGPLKYAESY